VFRESQLSLSAIRPAIIGGGTNYFYLDEQTEASLQTLVDNAIGAGSIKVTLIPPNDERNENCDGKDTIWFEWIGSYANRDMRRKRFSKNQTKIHSTLNNYHSPTITAHHIASPAESKSIVWDDSYHNDGCRGNTPGDLTLSANFTYNGVQTFPGIGGNRSDVTQNCIQTVNLLHIDSGSTGTWTLTFQGQTTAGLAPAISAAQLKTGLELLSNIDTVAVVLVGTGIYTVEFQGTNAAIDVQLMTGVATAIIGTRVDVSISQNAAATLDESQTIELIGGTSSGSWGITWDPGGGDESTATIAANASAATVETELEALASIAAGDVIVTGDAGGPYEIIFAATYAATDVNPMRPKTGFLTGGFGTVIAANIIERDTQAGRVYALIYDAFIEIFYTP